MTKPTVAFLGTGIMGLPMCGHLLDAGYPVRAWNRTRARAEPLAAKGGVLAETAASAVADADFVVIMLSNGPVVTEVLFGADAASQRLKAGSTVVVMSSIPVGTSIQHAKDLAAQGVRYADAPVSGGEKGAIDGNLTIMAGGDIDLVEHLRPILMCMGSVTRVGPVGCGQLAKLANQVIVGITIDAVAEALLLVEAGGGDLAAVRAALLGGFADSTILRQHGERMIEQDFAPGGKAKFQLKDLSAARDLANSLGRKLPMLELAEHLYREMCAAGMSQLDHSGLFAYLKERSRQSD